MEVERTPNGFNVTFIVSNTGKYDASEVAQLYISPVEPTFPRARRELHGFRKLSLKAGESRRVSIPLSTEDFSCYDSGKGGFITPYGSYKIIVASDASSKALTELINIK